MSTKAVFLGVTLGYSFEFDVTNNVILWALNGDVTADDLVTGLVVAAKLLPTLPPCRGIIDFSSAVSLDVPSDVMRSLARTPSILSPRSARVIVAPSAYVYGMARMFGIVSEDLRPNLHVVKTMAEAYAVLNLKCPTFRALSY
jgi:hypothetical protein